MEIDRFYKNLEDRFRGSSRSVKQRLDIYLPFLSEIDSYAHSDKVIDLGCGRCEWLEIAQNYNVSVVGIDIDQYMVKEALSKGLNVTNSDAIAYLESISDNSVGLITGFHIAEHLEFEYLRSLISQAYRCLAPGGVLILETPNPENLYTASVSFNLDPSHRKPLPPALLSFVIEQNGFERTNILRLNRNTVDARHVSLVDVIFNASPDFSVIAQKNRFAINEKIDDLFSANTGLLLDGLAHDYDGHLREIYESLRALDTKISDVASLREDVASLREGVARLREGLESVDAKICKVDSLREGLAEVDAKFSEIALLREGLASVDGSISEISDLHASSEKNSKAVAEVSRNLSALSVSTKEQGEWVLSFSQQQAEHIKKLEDYTRLLEKRVRFFETYSIFGFFSFLFNKIRELYWTITRILGYGYLHDGSRSVVIDESDAPDFSDGKNFNYANRLVLKNRSVLENLSYHRIKQAIEYITNGSSNREPLLVNGFNNKLPFMAFITPLPPKRTGIANYSIAVLPSIQRLYNIIIIVDDLQDNEQLSIDGGSHIKDRHWFEENAYKFDRIVYQFGNSEFHTYMLDLLVKFPGVVVLHDFYLGHFIGALDQSPAYKYLLAHEIYHSEGYGSLIKRFRDLEIESSLFNNPVNFTIIQQALGVILHNKYSLNLAQKFYGDDIVNHFGVVPLGRTINIIDNREKFRQELGILPDDIVVCSFGFLGPTKLSRDIFEAWKHAQFTDKTVFLFFVGEAPSGEYYLNLERENSEHQTPKVSITGYVDNATYQKYLAICDIAVQLRTNSRGETSAAALDCMGAGIATIVSNHGSFAEFPDNCVYKLDPDTNIREISISLSHLVHNPNLRSELGINAKNYVEDELNFSVISKKYALEIERFYQSGQNLSDMKEIYSAAQRICESDFDQELLVHEAINLAAGYKIANSMPQLLVDVSALVKEDLNTGIQRYTKSQIIELIKNPPINVRVEPVYLDEEAGRPFFRYANSFTLGLIEVDNVKLHDAPVVYGSNDIYYMPDLCYWSVQKCEEHKIYYEMRKKGVKFYFVAFDILPIVFPEHFPDNGKQLHTNWLKAVLNNADTLICISNSVKKDILSWIQECNYNLVRSVNLEVLHLGHNFHSSRNKEVSISKSHQKLLLKTTTDICFLMVGTIEPRKGHLDVLKEFEELWASGLDVSLIIVGREGWQSLKDTERRTIPEIINRLNAHEQRGHKLFWIDDASDLLLEKLYKSASCLIMASYGEGFGLPLIEAASYKLPIIARDIPVFREILDNNAVYFNGSKNGSLKSTIEHWVKSHKDGQLNSKIEIHALTWEQNVDELKIIFGFDK